MVGGIVSDVLVGKNKVWILCRGTDSERNTRCAIYVKRDEHSIRVKRNDKLWWQGGIAYWTPVDNEGNALKGFVETKLERIGFSGVNRPTVQDLEK